MGKDKRRDVLNEEYKEIVNENNKTKYYMTKMKFDKAIRALKMGIVVIIGVPVILLFTTGFWAAVTSLMCLSMLILPIVLLNMGFLKIKLHSLEQSIEIPEDEE